LRKERLQRMKRMKLVPKKTQLPPLSEVPIDRDDIANGYSGKLNPEWDSLPADRREDLAHRMATFAAMVEHVDQGVGAIVEDLEKHNELDNTLILFTSDNGACYEWGPFGFDGPSRRGSTVLHTGEDLAKIGQPGTNQSYGSAWANLGNTPLNMYKHFCHEGGIASPLIAHWPAGNDKPSNLVRDPAHIMDIVPTVLEAARLEYPKKRDGQKLQPLSGVSLLPTIDGVKLPERSIPTEHQGARGLRKGDWKIVWSKRQPDEIRWELYNLKNDLPEQNDLASKHPEKVKELVSEWETWAKKVGANPFLRDDGLTVEKEETITKVEKESPLIANRPIAITCEVTPAGGNGVIVAHGGREKGYALHLIDGRLTFDVRVNGKVTRIAAQKPSTERFQATASLTEEKMTISIDGTGVASGPSPGLIDGEPKDALSVGYDNLTAAGDYETPNRLDGKIHSWKVSSPKAKEMDQPVATADGAVPKPLFADPNYHGSCDPEIVWNREAKEWLIYYTARRATRESATYVGTPLGVIASKDLIKWEFRGYCSFDGVKGKPDMPDTHWAPGIIAIGDKLHMFATYKDNAVPPWGGKGVIRHYVTDVNDPIDGWKQVKSPDFNQPDPIDVSLLKIGDEFRAYYRVGNNGGIQWATSKDLLTWENQGKCPGDVNVKGIGYQEAPYVFAFGDWYWMLTDPHKGLSVFRSKDAITWKNMGLILADPGKGAQDATLARHPSVAVRDGRAFIFYHVEPNRPYPTPPAEKRKVEQKISFLQLAELKIVDGKLTCNRDAPVFVNAVGENKTSRWTKKRANNWYDRVGWPVGANFIPSTAINQLEMWQADTFDPETIDRELGWAARIGMNSMRVYLHDLAWKEDPEGFLDRVDKYLEISQKHSINTMLVFFDGVWNPSPVAGKQPEPRPRVHNSGWVQSPGRKILGDPSRHDELKPYVQAVIERFRTDKRILCWDLFNEPENSNRGKQWGGNSEIVDLEPELKKKRATELLRKTFAWAREMKPTQPLTAGVWGRPDWVDNPDEIEQLMLSHSDVISFHSYNNAESTRKMVEGLKKYGRPILCTEYMARGNQSTFESILPIFHEHKVGAYCWGLVDGKTQTIYPWNSWKDKFTDEPDPWHHDVFRSDGTPYSEKETELIKRLTTKNPEQFPKTAFIQVMTDRKPGPVMDAETIRAGLKSHDRALYIKSGWIRDPYITIGPDDYYYLTGTQPNEGDPREAENPYNLGLGDESIVGEQVRVWRSKDLIEWENLGPIFTIDDTFQATQGQPLTSRLIWAPEVHWMGDRWALVHCPKNHSSLALAPPGKDLTGPWTHPMGDSMGPRHDPSLFTDDDGTVYMLWRNTLVAPLSKDLTTYTGEPVRIDPAGTRPSPEGKPISHIGHEGATMMKVGGKYVHLGTAWSTDEGRKGSYNLYYCVADEITGPYGPRKFAGRFLGHGTPFKDKEGKWWCTAFFNANLPPLPREGIRERDIGDNAQTINEQGVTIVPLDVRMLDNGEVYIRAKDPDYANPGPDEAQDF
ncbi:MAG: family 43 glycosylhydrolase, partial [Verrucomicrobiota bacterium]